MSVEIPKHRLARSPPQATHAGAIHPAKVRSFARIVRSFGPIVRSRPVIAFIQLKTIVRLARLRADNNMLT